MCYNTRMKTKQPNMILMVGIARCGKSSWVKNFVKKHSNYCVISSDNIRKHIFGHQYHAAADPFVFSMAKAMAEILLLQGKDVIIDATLINKHFRSEWRAVARRTDAKVTVVWVYSDPDIIKNVEIAKRHNAKSPKGERLPVSAIERMGAYFESPDRDIAAAILPWFTLKEVHNKERK